MSHEAPAEKRDAREGLGHCTRSGGPYKQRHKSRRGNIYHSKRIERLKQGKLEKDGVANTQEPKGRTTGGSVLIRGYDNLTTPTVNANMKRRPAV